MDGDGGAFSVMKRAGGKLRGLAGAVLRRLPFAGAVARTVLPASIQQRLPLSLHPERAYLPRPSDMTLPAAAARSAIPAGRERAGGDVPDLSVIVVTHGNIELTRLCIDSLFANTPLLNFEVIVVDNASSDGTPGHLAHLEQFHANLRTVLNAENGGFAAANNQGLLLARGNHLVLLNNDTMVPRGWTEPLIRHLADPSVGLVGPMTNSIGNEACIAVDYKNLEGMEAFAARRATQFAGKAFDIDRLAMFCVMMRRDAFSSVGLLDEGFGIGMFEDDDYSKRMRAKGYRTVCAEDAFVHHFGQAAFRKLMASGEYDRIWKRNQTYYEQKWGPWQPPRARPLPGKRA